MTGSGEAGGVYGGEPEYGRGLISDMPDHKEPSARGLFGGVFARGGVEAGDTAWLQAMLDAEAGLARALERAGLAPAGSGEAVTAAAKAGNFDSTNSANSPR